MLNMFSIAETVHMKHCCSNEKSCNGWKKKINLDHVQLGKNIHIFGLFAELEFIQMTK